MPRDASGNYSLPPGINPVVPGTDIEADWANPTCQDIASALTDSLSRSGAGGMLTPMRFADGSLAAPGISWINHPQAGWYRAATDDFRYSINGIDIVQIAAAGPRAYLPLRLPSGIAASQDDAIAYAIALG